MRFGAIDKLLILLAEFCRTALLTFGIFTISQKDTAQDWQESVAEAYAWT